MRRIQSLFLVSMLFIMQSAFTYADGQKHLVKKGDTLYSLARQYGKTVHEIAKANSMGGP
ncbi:MAG: LysM peptidoglycan-binding domain-containing protein [Bacteroidetes bacterium]|nr:LysM peptidoglycan-binding domain-containing protein [Bacteroidota bacterium]